MRALVAVVTLVGLGTCGGNTWVSWLFGAFVAGTVAVAGRAGVRRR